MYYRAQSEKMILVAWLVNTMTLPEKWCSLIVHSHAASTAFTASAALHGSCAAYAVSVSVLAPNLMWASVVDPVQIDPVQRGHEEIAANHSLGTIFNMEVYAGQG